MPTLNLQVGASEDDGYAFVGQATADNTDSIANVGDLFGFFDADIYARFTGIADIAGKTITAATIVVKASDTDSSTTIATKIHAEAADNPAAPADGADYDSRTPTTEFVSWNPPSFVDGNSYTSPSLVTVIQAIADRPGLGDAILILWKDDGSNGGLREIHTFDGNPTDAMILHITYIDDGGGGTNRRRRILIGGSQ